MPHRECRFPRRLAGAFTLIELLVVISIIALLVSILLPALKRARSQAKQAMCLANLKAIGTASQTYAAEDDHEFGIPVHPRFGKTPRPYWNPAAYEWGGKSGIGESFDSRNPLDSVWGTANGYGPATRPLNFVLYKGGFADYQNDPGPHQAHWKQDTELDLRAFRCPGDRGYTGFHLQSWKRSGISSFDHYGNSYAANIILSPAVRMRSALRASMTPFYHPLSRISNPARTVLYTENCGRFGWLANGWESYTTGCGSAGGAARTVVRSAPARFDGWHGRPFHVVTTFVDGHAAVVKMNGIILPPPRLSHYPQIPGGHEDPYDTWRCFTLRSPDWQIDVLPTARAVITAWTLEAVAPVLQEGYMIE